MGNLDMQGVAGFIWTSITAQSKENIQISAIGFLQPNTDLTLYHSADPYKLAHQTYP